MRNSEERELRRESCQRGTPWGSKRDVASGNGGSDIKCVVVESKNLQVLLWTGCRTSFLESGENIHVWRFPDFLCLSAMHLPSWHRSIKWSCTYVYVSIHKIHMHTCKCVSTNSRKHEGWTWPWLIDCSSHVGARGRRPNQPSLFRFGRQQLYSIINMVQSTC